MEDALLDKNHVRIVNKHRSEPIIRQCSTCIHRRVPSKRNPPQPFAITPGVQWPRVLPNL